MYQSHLCCTFYKYISVLIITLHHYSCTICKYIFVDHITIVVQSINIFLCHVSLLVPCNFFKSHVSLSSVNNLTIRYIYLLTNIFLHFSIRFLQPLPICYTGSNYLSEGQRVKSYLSHPICHWYATILVTLNAIMLAK